MTDGESFSRVRRWIDEINKYCDDTIAKVLVGNKDDIEPIDGQHVPKVVTTEDAEQYARQMNLPFFETSAKDNKNVDAAFYAITHLALQQNLEARRKTQSLQYSNLTNGRRSSKTIRLKGSKKKEKKHTGSCCK